MYFFLFVRRKEAELYWTLFYLTLTDGSTQTHPTGSIRVPTEAIVLRVETKVSVLSKRVVTLDNGKRHECTRIYFTTGQKVTKGKQVVLDLPLRRREQTKSAYYHLLMTNKQTMKNTNTLKRFDASFDDSTTSGQRSVTQPSTTFYGLSQQDNLPPIEMRPTVSFNWYPNCFLSRQCSEVKYCFNRARSTFHRSSKHRGTSIW